MAVDPQSRPPAAPLPRRRLVGLRGLIGALRNLGVLDHGARTIRAPGPLVSDDGHAIAVRIIGAAQQPNLIPVVLLHGLGCTHAHWLPVARRLAARCRVLAWDARCHGRSLGQPAVGVTLARLALDLHQLLDHHRLEGVVLVGHSMGALTVLQYLRAHGPARVRAVALVDQSPRVVTDEHWRCGLFGGCSRDTLLGLIGSAREDLAGTVLREIEAAGRLRLPRHPSLHEAVTRVVRHWLGGFDAAALLDLAESLAEADYRELLPRLDRPLWVALGGRSPHYAGVPLADYYRRAVPHAAVTVYPRAGHSPHVSDPAAFARDLLRFIDDHA